MAALTAKETDALRSQIVTLKRGRGQHPRALIEENLGCQLTTILRLTNLLVMEYEFTLRLKLAADDADADEVVERLGIAGCDDAVVGIGQPGRIALNFIRDDDSAEKAVISALKDVKRAIPGAKLLEVSPDFVGLTDVAELVGVTRQNMRKLMTTHTDSFPAAVHEGSTAIWHLAHVLQWLNDRDGYRIEQALIDVAYIAMQINFIKEAGQLQPRVQRELRALVA
jgi:hypothetical protein